MYQVPCRDCNRTYISEMKRTFKVKFGEQKQAARRGGHGMGWCQSYQSINQLINQLRELLAEKNNGSHMD